MKHITAPMPAAIPLEIEFIPDAVGLAFVRDLLDAIEDQHDDGHDADAPGAVVELPVAMPDRLDPESIADLAGAIDDDHDGADPLSIDTVWQVFEHVVRGAGLDEHPRLLADALIAVGTTLDPDDAAKLRGRVNRLLRDHGASYVIGEEEGGAGVLVESPTPAFKFRRSRFRAISPR